MKRKAIEQARPTDFGLEPALWRTDASILEWLDALWGRSSISYVELWPRPEHVYLPSVVPAPHF